MRRGRKRGSTTYCSYCHNSGHNRRTCPELKQTIDKLPSDHYLKEKYQSQQKTTRNCSYCGKDVTHNAASCPDKVNDLAKYTRLNNAFQKEMIAYLDANWVTKGNYFEYSFLINCNIYVDQHQNYLSSFYDLPSDIDYTIKINSLVQITDVDHSKVDLYYLLWSNQKTSNSIVTAIPLTWHIDEDNSPFCKEIKTLVSSNTYEEILSVIHQQISIGGTNYYKFRYSWNSEQLKVEDLSILVPKHIFTKYVQDSKIITENYDYRYNYETERLANYEEGYGKIGNDSNLLNYCNGNDGHSPVKTKVEDKTSNEYKREHRLFRKAGYKNRRIRNDNFWFILK